MDEARAFSLGAVGLGGLWANIKCARWDVDNGVLGGSWRFILRSLTNKRSQEARLMLLLFIVALWCVAITGYGLMVKDIVQLRKRKV